MEAAIDQPKLKTKTAAREEYISKIFAGKTDRQLLEEQTHLARINVQNVKSIKGMVSFFVWISCISLGIGLIAALLS